MSHPPGTAPTAAGVAPTISTSAPSSSASVAAVKRTRVPAWRWVATQRARARLSNWDKWVGTVTRASVWPRDDTAVAAAGGPPTLIRSAHAARRAAALHAGVTPPTYTVG